MMTMNNIIIIITIIGILIIFCIIAAAAEIIKTIDNLVDAMFDIANTILDSYKHFFLRNNNNNTDEK